MELGSRRCITVGLVGTSLRVLLPPPRTGIRHQQTQWHERAKSDGPLYQAGIWNLGSFGYKFHASGRQVLRVLLDHCAHYGVSCPQHL